jgi:two-component system CheB/CheR fusion protein
MNPKSGTGNLPPDRSKVGLPEANQATEGFPIVGIGASAGGLASFEAFFSGMPEKTDPAMAFVLVQHLAPDHKSVLSELVRRYTRMQVFEVEDGMRVRKNCAYIIPPNRDMAFVNGTLQLLEPSAPRGHRLPIDYFFRSLANDQHERAIGIVLSGSGSDGTLGVRTIKGQGGMVMAQDPDSAEADSMPSSAIATGLVDFVLPPADMPAQLISYVRRAFARPQKPTRPIVESDDSLNKVFSLLRAQVAHDFSQYKASTIQRRLERRMVVHNIGSIDDYIKLLQQSPEEVESLFHDMLIGVTQFFRDPEAFDALREQVITRLVASKSEDEIIRIWVPGCSTGEEAYSLAILLTEHLSALKQNTKVQIFATDIDSQALAIARTGLYPSAIEADISTERLRRFFSPDPDKNAYRVHKGIRSLLVFSEHNLIRDPPFSKLDLISCRNLLIYLNADLQKTIIPLFHYALNPNGYLFLGASESVNEFGDLFSSLNSRQKIYQRKHHSLSSHHSTRFLPPMTPKGTGTPQIADQAAAGEKVSLRQITERALLNQIFQAAALVTAEGDLLYLHGRAGMYLEPATGESGINNILEMAREGLRHDLTMALRKTVKTAQTVCCPVLKVKTNGDFSAVNLLVRPVSVDSSVIPGQILYLVIMERMKEPIPPDGSVPATPEQPASINQQTHHYIAHLKRELQARDEYLQSVREELVTSNEEMQSVNEELQSTNEELETSKEELQSVNEELSTVNAELQTKVADLSQTNNDMNNLLAGTGIATVFVDHQLCIVRFTPASTQIINLIQSDIGRPIGHIVSNLLEYSALSEDINDVLDTLIPKALDVQSMSGRWYRMRIQPYRTIDNVIEGAVISFIDITETKLAHEDLAENEEKLRTALAATPMILSHQDRALRYTWIHDTNPEANPAKIIGRTDFELFSDEGGARLTDLKQKVLEAGKPVRQAVWMTIEGKNRLIDLTIQPMIDETGLIEGLICTQMDITDHQGSLSIENLD